MVTAVGAYARSGTKTKDFHDGEDEGEDYSGHQYGASASQIERKGNADSNGLSLSRHISVQGNDLYGNVVSKDSAGLTNLFFRDVAELVLPDIRRSSFCRMASTWLSAFSLIERAHKSHLCTALV